VFATLVEAPLALGLAHGAWEAFFLAGHFGLSHTGQLSETVMAGRLGELLDDARTLVPLRLALALALAPWMRLPAPKFGPSAPTSGAANAPTGSPTDAAADVDADAAWHAAAWNAAGMMAAAAYRPTSTGSAPPLSPEERGALERFISMRDGASATMAAAAAATCDVAFDEAQSAVARLSAEAARQANGRLATVRMDFTTPSAQPFAAAAEAAVDAAYVASKMVEAVEVGAPPSQAPAPHDHETAAKAKWLTEQAQRFDRNFLGVKSEAAAKAAWLAKLDAPS